MKLNVGCGRNILDGWTNIDSCSLPGVDTVADLENCRNAPLPFEENSVDEFLLSHVLEHIRQPLPLMEELWRVSKPGASMTIRVPHGASDDAWEDPTHVRAYFGNSFGYFSQPFYWRADYGYRGDWQCNSITYLLEKKYSLENPAGLEKRIFSERNIVLEMIVQLQSVKPRRPCGRELQVRPLSHFRFG